MTRTINSQGTVHVFTYKDGLLSAVAHDLRLTLHRFELVIDEADGRIEGRFFGESLAVDGAMRSAELHPGDLSAKDSRDILDNVLGKKLLHTARHREVTFTGKGVEEASGVRIEGELQLVGRRARVDSFSLRREGQRLRGEVTIQPSRWGIKPFKALLGAIKLQDRVKLVFDLPAE